MLAFRYSVLTACVLVLCMCHGMAASDEFSGIPFLFGRISCDFCEAREDSINQTVLHTIPMVGIVRGYEEIPEIKGPYEWNCGDDRGPYEFMEDTIGEEIGWRLVRHNDGFPIILSPDSEVSYRKISAITVTFPDAIVEAPLMRLLRWVSANWSDTPCTLETYISSPMEAYLAGPSISLEAGTYSLLELAYVISASWPLWQLNLSYNTRQISLSPYILIQVQISPFACVCQQDGMRVRAIGTKLSASDLIPERSVFEERLSHLLVGADRERRRLAQYYGAYLFAYGNRSEISSRFENPRALDWIILFPNGYEGVQGFRVPMFGMSGTRVDAYDLYLRYREIYVAKESEFDDGTEKPDAQDLLMIATLSVLSHSPYERLEREYLLEPLCAEFWDAYLPDVAGLLWRAPARIMSFLEYAEKKNVKIPEHVREALHAQYRYAKEAESLE